jgi:hypothetical protein
MSDYNIWIYYRSDSREGEHSSSLIFKSGNDRKAIEDAVKWFGNRHKSVPDIWSTLVAIKACHFSMPEIREDGYLPSPTGFGFFEWKYDWPGTLKGWLDTNFPLPPSP